ncbi:MAG: DUF1822 family protein [Cyanobacteriota bacterium]|nr:DUF1822 family protein [Cyanobacteriota bacterium]
MNKNNQFSDEDWSIPIPLTTEILRIARQFANEQPNPKSEKAQQVYLNTLAVCAVNNYLRIIGIPTDLTLGDSWNSSIRLTEDVADLWITGKGGLECRPIKKGALTCYIPPLVGFKRIAYIIVEIDEEQKEARLQGFTPNTPVKQYLSLDDLDSILKLPSYLHKLRPSVNLSQWFRNIFETGWENVETVLSEEQTPQTALAFRSKSKINSLKRCKLLKLGNQRESVALIVTITPESESNINILIELQPDLSQNYLPANLRITLLDEEEKKIIDTVTETSNQHIQLDLSGEPGEKFSLKITLGEATLSEYFII